MSVTHSYSACTCVCVCLQIHAHNTQPQVFDTHEYNQHALIFHLSYGFILYQYVYDSCMNERMYVFFVHSISVKLLNYVCLDFQLKATTLSNKRFHAKRISTETHARTNRHTHARTYIHIQLIQKPSNTHTCITLSIGARISSHNHRFITDLDQ